MAACGMTYLDASPGQMSVNPDGTAAVGEVIYSDIWSYRCQYAYTAGLPDL